MIRPAAAPIPRVVIRRPGAGVLVGDVFHMRDGARTAAAGSRRAFRCFAVALLPLAWGVVGAEQQPPAIMPVRVKTVEGEVTTGKLARFSLADGVALLDAAGRQSTVPADRTVSVEIDRIGPAAHPAGALGVHLTNGDVVFGQIVAGNESSFKILHADLGAIAMPFDSRPPFGQT